MKILVTEFPSLSIQHLARGSWLLLSSQFEWVWRINNGMQKITVTIRVLKGILELTFAGDGRTAVQTINLTDSRGPHGGTRS